MLAIAPLREFIAARRVPLVAVSPIVAGSAVKGPAAKIMRELGIETSVAGVVAHYGALVDGWVIDAQDAAHEAAIVAAGHAVTVVDTLMTTPEKSRGVAEAALGLARQLAAAR
jgi:LPPG:FO 2-phospho-L-lactate transferase